MNIVLWVLQALLAVHTAIGALWKFSNTVEQTMPSLAAIPNGAWTAMSIIELLCALGLVIPAFSKSLGTLAPVAAVIIAAEMLLFCVLHLSSGASGCGPVFYWSAVAAVCALIAYGRLVLKPS